MKILKGVIRNSLYLGVGQGINGILYFIITIYLARIFGAEKFGMFSFAESVFLFFSLIAIFGSDVVGARQIAQGDNKQKEEIVSKIVSLRIVFAIAAFMMLLIFAFVIKNPLETKFLLLVFGVAVFSLIFLLDWYFWGTEKFNVYSACIIIPNLLFLGGTILVTHAKKDILLVGLVFLLSKIFLSISLLIYYLKTNKTFTLHKFSFTKEVSLISSCSFLFWASIAGWVVNYFDIALLSILYKEQSVGYYSAAFKPIFYVSMVFIVYFKAIFPILSQAYRFNPDGFRAILKFTLSGIMLLFLPLIVIAYLYNKNIIVFIYGGEYLKSADSFRILLFVLAMMPINTLCSQALIASGKEKKNLKFNLIVGTANIFFALLLIPSAGIAGAAWSKFIAQLIGLVYCYRILFQFLRT